MGGKMYPERQMMPHMVKVEIDAKILEDEQVELGWETEDNALHSMLYSKFMDGNAVSLRPYRLRRNRDGGLCLLGYSDRDKSGLESIIRHNRPRYEPRCFRWETLKVSAPLRLDVICQPGRRLGFELRYCATDLRRYDHGRKQSAERAHYLTVNEQAPRGIVRTRQETDRDWLRLNMETARPRGSGPDGIQRCEIEHIEFQDTSRSELQFSRYRRVEQFDSGIARGVVRVCDPELFSHAITHGIGSKQAYGFGMLLLEPSA